jgi:hypothetical protein
MFPSTRLLLLTVPSALILTSGSLRAQCCSGSWGSGSAPAASPAPAVTSIRVEYNGSSPAVLKYGDHKITLLPNTNQSYPLPALDGAVPPLPGEQVPAELLGADGTSPPPADAEAKVDEPNKKSCPAPQNTGNPGIGTGDQNNLKLTAAQPTGTDNAGGSNGGKGEDEHPRGGGYGDNRPPPDPGPKSPPAGRNNGFGGEGAGDAGGARGAAPQSGSAGLGGASPIGGEMTRATPTMASPNPPVITVPARLDFTQNLGQDSSGNAPIG